MDDEKIDSMIDEFGWVFDTPVKKLDLRCQFKSVAKAARRELIEWLKEKQYPAASFTDFRMSIGDWQSLLKELIGE